MRKNIAEPFTFYHSVDDISQKQWNKVAKKDHLYLSLTYLKALEKTLAGTITPIYVLVCDSKGEPIASGVFQIATFTYLKTKQQSLFNKLFKEYRNEDNSFSIKGLVCGNIFATGEHGFAHSDRISMRAAVELMASAAKQIKNDALWKDRFKVILFKDFWPNSVANTYDLEDFNYRSFQADVNMILSLQPSWKTFEDYLQSMKAKYRTKAKSAYKKSKKLSIRSLSHLEIKQLEDQIRQLFNNVVQKSNYRYGDEFPSSFATIKENLGDSFLFKGVFLKNELIAFSTSFLNANNLEANYVGLNYTYNAEYAVYERILYDYVKQAIESQVNQLHLGRTSELIKSALGAEPVEMTLFAKHTSKIKNALLRPFLEKIKPSFYQLRRPFNSNVQ